MCEREREWVSEGEGERLSEGAGARECGEHQVRERERVSRLEGVCAREREREIERGRV